MLGVVFLLSAALASNRQENGISWSVRRLVPLGTCNGTSCSAPILGLKDDQEMDSGSASLKRQHNLSTVVCTWYYFQISGRNYMCDEHTSQQQCGVMGSCQMSFFVCVLCRGGILGSDTHALHKFGNPIPAQCWLCCQGQLYGRLRFEGHDFEAHEA